ncbi:MAG: peptidase S10 [Gammaproteobacteria bacterium]|nr:MAG: peptidase S10 [Gammaproteobacteria bacterium]
MKKIYQLSLLFITCLVLSPVSYTKDKEKNPAEIKPVQSFTSHHSGKFNGKKINYTAIAGETLLKNKKGEVTARLFSTSYTKDSVKDNTKRAIAFFYNGGPGSSSVWLHMGVLGPKRVDIPSDAKDDGAAPYPIKHNPKSLLDVTDMVFIDPIGTGYSKVDGVGKGKDFWGVTEDAKSLAQFIRLWLTKHERWNSPKFIGGESYGTTRSAALINQLEGGYGDVSINGIILISTILDFSVRAYDPGNEMAYMAYLPTMAATAHYHHKAGNSLKLTDFVQQARDFAQGEYISALLKGNDLSPTEHNKIRKQLAFFTGLSEHYLDLANLRVSYPRFSKELLRDQGLTVGRLDSRFKGNDFDNAGETPDNDPSFYGIDGAYTAAINEYLRKDLKVKIDREYNIIGLDGKWNWDISNGYRNPYLNVAPYIGKAMRENKHLRVFNAAGYYDFATPFMGAEYSLNRNGIDEKRVTKKYYEAGHMMYIHHPSLNKLVSDIRAFISNK